MVQNEGNPFKQNLSKQVWEDNYKWETDETVWDSFRRVAKFVASVEKDKKYWEEEYYRLLSQFKYIPGGRILSNAGTSLKKTTLLNCFHRSAQVLTSEGNKYIDQVNIGDLVLTHKGRWRKVVNVLSRFYEGDINVYSGSVFTSDILVTPEHPMYQGFDKWENSENVTKLTFCYENEAIEQNDIKIDLITLFDLTDIVYDDFFIWKETPYIGGNGAHGVKYTKKIKRFLTITPDFAYALGIFVGDGCTYTQAPYDSVMSFNIAFNEKDLAILERVKGIFEDAFGFSLNINKTGNNWFYLRKMNSLAAHILNYYCGDKSYSKKIPEFIWTSRKEVKEQFLLGLLDSDGSVGSGSAVKLTLSNKKLIQDIKTLGLLLGYPFTIRKETYIYEQMQHEPYILLMGAYASTRLRKKLSKTYEDNRLLNEYTDNGCNFFKLSEDTSYKFETSNFIKEIEDYSDYVYNISVEEDESYIVNNVIVHNCYVGGFRGKNQDSISSIYDELARQAKTLSSEGGYGCNFDVLRPRGSFVSGIGVETSGTVQFMELWDTSSSALTKGSGFSKKDGKGKGKIRKGAMMATLSCWHPAIEEFITAKKSSGVLTKFNLSVLVTNDFIECVKKNLPWNLEFPDTEYEKYDNEWDGNLATWKEKNYPVIVWKTFDSAVELWDLIVTSTYNRNEPGVLFVDRINELNNLHYCENITATNPCLTGDTIVAVADGRNGITFKELAEEGKDVPVYCFNNEGALSIRTMRHPRITGYNKDIYRVTLDDGNYIDCTENHKFILKDMSTKEAKDLISGDSLNIVSKTKMNGYYRLYYNNKSTFEHRFIYEQLTNDILEENVIHHINGIRCDNRIENLIKISSSEHSSFYHDISGENNPIVRFPEKNIFNNVEWQNEQRRNNHIGKKRSKETCNRIGEKTKERFKDNSFCERHSSGVKKSWQDNRQSYERGFKKREKTKSIKRLEECQERTDLKCFLINTVVFVEKTCEVCGDIFNVKFNLREQSYCSKNCSSKKGIIKLKEKYLSIKEEKFDKAITLFKKFVSDNKEVPDTNVFLELLNDEDINDYRTLGFISYQQFLNAVTKDYNVVLNSRSLLNNKNDYNKYKAEELLEVGMGYNHKVISVKKIGVDTVYNGTVDDFHNFCTILPSTKKTRKGNFKMEMVGHLQCGEEPLPTDGSCNLGSINLTQYMNEKEDGIDFKSLKEDIPTIVRFQDAIIDLTNYPLPGQKAEGELKRRVGIGYTGYGSLLYLLKLPYASETALKFTEKLVKTVTNTIYQASSDLAVEKGCFPAYDLEEYLKSKFIKQALTDSTIDKIRKQGIRNGTLTTVAPTGNTSIFANCCSGGLEPVVSAEYIRSVIETNIPEGLILPINIDWDLHTYEVENGWEWILEGDDWLLKKVFNDTTYKIDKNRGLTREEVVYDYAVLQMGNEFDEKADYVKNIFNLTVEEHLDTLQVFARYIDSSISKTLNVSNDYPYDDFKNVYMEAFDSGYIKGVTTYREGTMASVLSVKSSSSSNDCFGGSTPERPKSLPCHIHRITVKGDKWLVFIGFLEGHPFEVFSGKVDLVDIPSSIKEASIIKSKSKVYQLEHDGEIIIKDIGKIFDSSAEESITRLISLHLKRKTPIEDIITQLGKSYGTIVDFNKAIVRALKKHMKDMESTDLCPNCGAALIFQEGCLSCRNCGMAKCG